MVLGLTLLVCPCCGCHITSFDASSRLCSSRARWPVAPNFCSRGTIKSLLFHRNHMLGTLDFTSSEHWAPFNFCQSTALLLLFVSNTMPSYPHSSFPDLARNFWEVTVQIFICNVIHPRNVQYCGKHSSIGTINVQIKSSRIHGANFPPCGKCLNCRQTREMRMEQGI